MLCSIFPFACLQLIREYVEATRKNADLHNFEHSHFSWSVNGITDFTVLGSVREYLI